MIRYPPKYNSFVPPAAGRVFKDLAFKTPIRRVSACRKQPDNAAGTGMLPYIATEYSTVSPFNCDNTRLLLQHGSYFGLYSVGPQGKYLKDLPFQVNASAEPRWSRTEANRLYFINGNQLIKLAVPNGVVVDFVDTFSEYTKISGKGEADIGWDHFVLCGDDRWIFTFQLSTGHKSAVLDTAGTPFDAIYSTPDKNVLVVWNETGEGLYRGIQLFNSNMVFQRQVTRAGGHMDVTRDTNGDEVLIWTNSNDSAPINDCDNAIVKVRLSDGKQTCLLPLDWSQAVHVSCPDGNGWCFVETYQDTDPASKDWKVYTNEILQVKLDGSEVRRLLHHRSRPSGYGSQPKVTCSRDGKKLAFTSNMGLPQNLGWPSDYTDVYMLGVAL